MAERPDVYVKDVTKSVVLEIKAGELVASAKYPTFYSLRFPRVMKIRYDKNWDEAMDVSQLNDLISNFDDARRMNKHKRQLEVSNGSQSSRESHSSFESQIVSKPKAKRKRKQESQAPAGK